MGTPARVLGEGIGDASALSVLRSILIKDIATLSVECLVAARRQGLVDEVRANVGDVDDLGFAGFVKMLTITHFVHARRRMEEVEKAMENVAETGVPARMSEAIVQQHARTVAAKLYAAEIAGADLDAALRILDERVITPSSGAG